MIAITSIARRHVNRDIQHKAVQSWIDLGMKVYSMNGKAECDRLRELYPNVTFIETARTMEKTYKRPFVAINAIAGSTASGAEPAANVLAVVPIVFCFAAANTVYAVVPTIVFNSSHLYPFVEYAVPVA